jgi:Uma2 family endonuclease
MSAVLPTVAPPATAGPRPLHWTCDLFHAVCDTGILEGRNVILVNGELLEMPPPKPPHNTGLTLADEVLRAVFRPGYVVRNQMALDLAQDIDPVPDLAFVPGAARDYANRQPSTAALVVEVADSTLDYDTTTKAELYATAGIPDYWVLDVVGRQLLVFRNPAPIPDGGGTYRDKQTLGPDDTVSPLAVPAAAVKVADLLP